MRHLSIKGVMGDSAFCGLSRSQVLDQGGEVFHPEVRFLESANYRKKFCSGCLAVWDNPELPTNPMPGQPLHRAAVGNQ